MKPNQHRTIRPYLLVTCGLVLLAATLLATRPPHPTTAQPTTAYAAQQESSSLLQAVQERGRLVCGIHGELPGFSYIDPNGQYSGFDVDFCRAVAAALFGDPTRMEFRTFAAGERFEAVRQKELDVLFRNTTWTASRDTQQGVDFGPTIFYDGQGFMTSRGSGISTLEDLAGVTVCVQRGTTSETNLNDQLGIRDIGFEPLVIDGIDAAYRAYENGDCQVISSDRSQLVAQRTQLAAPEDHIILEASVSREPLGPVFIENDSTWRDVVNWSVFATIYADELGVNQANVEEMLESDDPRVQRLLGVEGNIGENLGLSNDFALNIIRAVGSYSDIYERNLGEGTPFNLDHGPNQVWNQGAGGVLASPPFR